VRLAPQSLASGYQSVIFAAALVALFAAAATWVLISAQETAPHEATGEPLAVEVLID